MQTITAGQPLKPDHCWWGQPLQLFWWLAYGVITECWTTNMALIYKLGLDRITTVSAWRVICQVFATWPGDTQHRSVPVDMARQAETVVVLSC